MQTLYFVFTQLSIIYYYASNVYDIVCSDPQLEVGFERLMQNQSNVQQWGYQPTSKEQIL